MPSQVYWGVPLERSIQHEAVNALLGVALEAGKKGYIGLTLPYLRTDVARNKFVATFCEMAQNREDVLVMLDADMLHPPDVLERLTRWEPEVGVVGVRYYRRGQPFDPLLFLRLEDGKLHSISDWEPQAALIRGAAVGTGGIAIRRWVFMGLQEAGFGPPYFRYRYPDGKEYPTEDMYFADMCERAGIAHYMDMTVESPHLTSAVIDHNSWLRWKADHPDEELHIQVAGQTLNEVVEEAPSSNGHI